MRGQALRRATHGCACKFSFVKTPSNRDSTDWLISGLGLQSVQNMQQDSQESSVRFRSTALITLEGISEAIVNK
jgi:hypothetical protein